LKSHDEKYDGASGGAGFLPRRLRGILLPFPTPFDGDGGLDAAALRSNLGKWNRTGINGYVALGSTGERVNLDEREYLEVIETARAAVPRELAFIAGAGQQGTHATINEVRRAAGAGADAVLVITPHFYRAAMTQDALVRHYLSVADAATIPLLLYSMPDLTGIALAPETVARLAEHENIIGIKDSSGDLINLTETLRLVPREFAVLTGHGGLLYAALSAGACGAILAVGCVAPRLAAAIFGAVAEENHERARVLQQRLTPLALAVTKRYGIGGLKAALEIVGYSGGAVRTPLREAGEEAREHLARLIEESARVDQAEAGGEHSHLAGAATSE
jgi:4-hydroxy-2-oxoglutarate aldolase